MKGVSVLFFVGLCTPWVSSVFLNNRPSPTYSLENMPSTTFSCRDKILGGYYADAETQCQMFHICVKVAGIGIQDFRFLCPNGTAFDQDHQICAEWEDIDCDATTLYYSSDNFDLYRIGSGYESKAHRYGEDEETFSLQRAETGDARINHEQQTKIVDQTKTPPRTFHSTPRQSFNNNNNDKDIFKGSSSSNFYNNRNNGKERDYDYDDNVNINQNQQYEQRRKVIRNKVRRPVQNNQNENRNQETQTRRPVQNEYRNQETQTRRPVQNEYRNQETQTRRPVQNEYRNQETQTRRPVQNEYRNQETQTRGPTNKNTGFVNNFAGSYEPTTTKPSSTTLNVEQYTTAINNYRSRNGQRRQQSTSEYTDSPVYTISTPAPFKQQQYNSQPSRTSTNTQYTSAPTRGTENYSTNNFDDISKVKISTVQDYSTPRDVPKVKPQKTTFSQYEATKVKQTFKTTPFDKTENYPSNNPKYSTTFDKKPTTPVKQTDNYPTTLSPKPFSVSNNFPTTFAPRTNAAYSQIAQQTAAYNQNKQNNQNSTPKSTPFTQYTPTIPKISSTTPVSRSSRFDETSYDDGSYSSKYDYDGDRREDEFLKTAHSQNIAASRNELQRTTNNKQQQTTLPVSRTTYDVPKTYPSTPKVNKEVTKSFPPTPKVSQATEPPKSSTHSVSKKPASKKKDYDYAYYDSSVGSEPDYDIDTEIKKSTVKN